MCGRCSYQCVSSTFFVNMGRGNPFVNKFLIVLHFGYQIQHIFPMYFQVKHKFLFDVPITGTLYLSPSAFLQRKMPNCQKKEPGRHMILPLPGFLFSSYFPKMLGFEKTLRTLHKRFTFIFLLAGTGHMSPYRPRLKQTH